MPMTAVSETLSRRRHNSGFTLVELLITAALVAVAMGMLVSWFHHGGNALHKSMSTHDLEMEAADTNALLSTLLRRADPASIVISSGPAGPWSHMRFAADSHTYEFYAQQGELLFVADQLQPKRMSRHLLSLQFSPTQAHLPTLLTWTIRLANGHDSLLSARFSLSGSQFLDRSPE